jgi:phage tail-like protein
MPPEAQTPIAQPEPLRQYLFKVDVNNTMRLHFSECEGFGVRVKPIPYREAGSNEIVHQLVGTVEYLPVRLRFGVVQGDYDALWAWVLSGIKGLADKKNVSVVMLDAAGQRKMQWDMLGCWPVEYVGGKLGSQEHGLLIQDLVLVYDELKYEPQSAGG